MAEERIQKIMAEQGLCSRRAAEQIIAEGRVKVNGHPVKVGDKMDPHRDVLHVDDQRMAFALPVILLAPDFAGNGQAVHDVRRIAHEHLQDARRHRCQGNDLAGAFDAALSSSDKPDEWSPGSGKN